MQEEPIITLPDDEQLVRKLKLKLDEYRVRFEAENGAYLPLEELSPCWYNIKILEKLIEEGTVHTWELSRVFYAELGNNLNLEAMQNAFAVIDAYATGRLEIKFRS